MQPGAAQTLEIDGATYVAAAEVARLLKVARQTIWRWRQAGRIPQGRRFRDRQVVFTIAEVEVIRDYANKLEPAALHPSRDPRVDANTKGRRHP